MNIINKSSLQPQVCCHNGFTLAETLITLVIVGVIAALTVPTLITKYQKEQTVTRLKKTYSTLAQTTARAIADNGPLETWEVGQVGNPNDTKIFINKYLAPYLSLIRKPIALSEDSQIDKTVLTLNNANKNMLNKNNWVRMYLADGSSVSLYLQSNTSTVKYYWVLIDINGDKKPNKLGRDIFEYYYNIIYSADKFIHGRFVPGGLSESRETLVGNGTYACNKNREGTRCAALIMKDGWRIADDYPW